MTDHKVTWLDQCAWAIASGAEAGVGESGYWPEGELATYSYKVAQAMLDEKLRIESEQEVESRKCTDCANSANVDLRVVCPTLDEDVTGRTSVARSCELFKRKVRQLPSATPQRAKS